MAAGNDTVNIKVKYIPDTSALKNIKEIRMPEIKVGGKDAGKGVFDSYNNAIRDLNRELSKGTDASAITKAFKTVGEETQKVKTQINSMKEAINQSFQSPSNQSLIKDYQNLEKQLKKLDAESQKRRKKSAELSSFKSQNNMSTPQARKEISKAEALVASGEKLTKQDQERLEIAKQIIAKEEELAKLRTQEEIRSAQKDIKNQMSDSKYDPMITSTEANRVHGQYNDILSQTGVNLNNVTGEQRKYTEALKEGAAQAKENQKELVKIGDLISATFLGTSLSSLFQTAVSNGIKFFKEYDETLTRTMMVTGMSRKEVNSLTASYNELATKLSSTTKSVAAAQLVFYQQGLSTREAMEMTKASIAISKTGGIEAAEAADRLTAALRGYQLSANEAMSIADKMSALDAAAASSVDELTVAMQKSASQARMAGLDLDYYMAYLSTMQEVTREAPENIGTAMKSITSRLQEIKDIGKIEEDGTTFSNVAKALNSIGIAATDSSGQLRTLQDIMDELGPMWDTLDRNHKAYIATVLAGNRQQSRFIALMDNYDRAMELVNVSQNANGESAKQLRAYNQGLEASFTRLSNAWQKFATQLVESSSISRIVQQLAKLIEVVNKFPTFVRGAAALYTLNKSIDALNKIAKSNLSQQIKNLLNVKPDSNGLRWYDTAIDKIKQYIRARKENLELNKEEIKDNQKHSLSMSEDAAQTDRNTDAKKRNAGANEEEKTEQGAVSEAVKAKADSYRDSTKAINQEEAATKGNKGAYAEEIDEEIKIAKSNISNAQQRRDEAKKRLKPLIDDAKKSRNFEKKFREEAIKEENLTKKAIESLREKGLEKPRGEEASLRMTFDDRIYDFTDKTKDYQDALEKEKKWWYTYYGIRYNNANKAYKDYLEELRKNNPDDKIIAEEEEFIKKEQERLDELRKELEKKIGKGKGKGKGKEEVPEQKDGLLSAITSPLIVKSLAQMGTSILGVNSGVSELVGNFASLGYVGVKSFKAIKKAADKGGNSVTTVASSVATAAVMVIGVIGSISQMINGLEANQERLDKVLEESSSIGDKISKGKKALETYNKISRKIIKTEEDQQQLNAAANELGDTLPEIVTGYDAVGNSIISAAAAQIELNKLMEKKQKLDNQSLDLYEKTTKAKGKADPWGNMVGIGAPLMSAAAALAPVTGGISLVVGGVITGLVGVGTAIYNVATEADRTTEALIEDRDEIIGALKSITQVLPEYETLKNRIVEDIYSQGIDEGFGLEEMRKRLADITKQLNSTGLTAFVNRMKIKVADPNIVYDDFKKQVIDGLKKLGFSDEQINLTFDGIVNLIFDGKFNYSAVMEALLEKLKDKTISEQLRKGLEQVLRLDKRLIEELYTNGMLDESFIEGVFGDRMAEYINDAFYVDNKYDATAGIGKLIEDSYEKTEEYEEKVSKLQERAKILQKNIKDIDDDVARNFYNEDGGWFGSSIAIPVNDIGQIREDTWSAEDYKKFVSGEISSDEYRKKIFEGIEASKGLSDTQKEGAKTAASLAILQKEYELELERTNKELEDTVPKLENLTGANEELIRKYRELNAMPTFKEMADGISTAISPLKELNSVLSNIYEQNGTVTFDNLISLLNVLQQIQEKSLEAGISTEYFNQACAELSKGISLENGAIHMNISATETMQTVAAAAYRAQVQQMANKIENNVEEMKMQKAMIDQEIAFLEEKLLTAKDGADAEELINTDLKNYLDSVHVASVKATKQRYKDELTAAEAYYSQLTAMQLKAAQGEKVTAGQFTGIFESLVRGVGQTIKNEIDFTNEDEKTGWRQQVENRIARLREQSKNLGDAISGQGELKQKLIQLAKDPDLDLGKMLGNGLEKASDALDEYIGKLERTFNLIQKIGRLSHQISDNSNLKDLYKNYDGKKYADSILTELGLMKERYDYQKDLFALQQEELGKQRGKIENSPYASLFKFDKNDLIQIDWDIYKGLSGKDQEEIDTLVDRYEELQSAVESTEIEMAEFAKKTQEAWLEMEDTIIKAENEIVNALKNREKILHDARTKALDDEIKMIEKAVEARKKAQEDDNSNKELYKAQEALRRATLDSSGKNNAQLLQLQQDLEDKQLEIAEKRFEDDMDDRKQWLQDTKDAETETYEYRLEKMTWYWEEAQEIMNSGTENIMKFLMAWDEQYQIESDTAKEQTKRGWQVMYEQIQQLYDKGFDLTTFHNQMSSVVTDLANQEINIRSIETAWAAATKAASNYSAAINNKLANRMIGTGNIYNSDDNGKGDVGPLPESPDTSYTQYIGSEVEIKGKGTYTGYDISGKQKVYKKSQALFGGNENLIVQEIMKKENTYYALGKPMSGPNKGEEHWIPVDELQTLDFWGGKKLKKNANGGLVDYTGPTWVDGTKTKPEAFLSAYQTEQIGALAKSLDPSTINNATTNSNVTFGSINFNVASMSSAADGKKALDIFVQGANDMMAKKGIGTKLNINMK